MATISIAGRLSKVKEAKNDVFDTFEYRAFPIKRRGENTDGLDVAKHA